MAQEAEGTEGACVPKLRSKEALKGSMQGHLALPVGQCAVVCPLVDMMARRIMSEAINLQSEACFTQRCFLGLLLLRCTTR
jgi:hypothetical protein